MEHSPARVTGARADRENLAGLVERVTFHNEDSGFYVLRVKARDQRDLITVVGDAAFGQQILDVPEAELKTQIAPNRMPDHGRRELVTSV